MQPGTRFLRRWWLWRPLAAAALLAAAGAAPAQAPAPPGGRLMPPADLACPRDQLTLYAGEVLRYQRRGGRTEVRIRTEWQTTETVVLQHPGRNDPTAWMRIDGKAFTAADWPRIEQAPGRLRPGVRVAAWVCDDGRNATLEWTPPRAP